MASDPIRDDSTPAFPVNPPEAYPLHAAFEMPAPIPPRSNVSLLAELSILRHLLSRWLSLKETGAGCDLVTASYEAIHGSNGNSGARAPIQYEGQG